MKYLPLLLIFLFASCSINKEATKLKAPKFAKGQFMDDYGIKYEINDSTWVQNGKTKYNILKWNIKEGYLIAQNDRYNKYDAGLFTRIDFIKLDDMNPFLWGFCLSAYKAKDIEEAMNPKNIDVKNPKKGCNGYPFSRMKKVN